MELETKYPGYLIAWAKDIALVGSRSAGGFTDESDYDFSVLVADLPTAMGLTAQLEREGFTRESDDYPDSLLVSYRKDDVNLLLTLNPAFHYACIDACAICRALNLQTRPERITLHQVLFKERGLV